MSELFKSTDEELKTIKNKILKDVDHNSPKIVHMGSQNFLEAMSIGCDLFSDSKLKSIVNDSQGE